MGAEVGSACLNLFFLVITIFLWKVYEIYIFQASISMID